MNFSDDPNQVQLASFGFRKGEKFLYEYDFFNNWKHLVRIEDIVSFDPKKKYPLCASGRNLSISMATKKAEGFAEIEDEISNQLKDKLPAFLEKYKELINFVTVQENDSEAIGIIRGKVKKLQDEAVEIKRLNQLLMPETFKRRKVNRQLLSYSQNRGKLPEDDWDEV